MPDETKKQLPIIEREEQIDRLYIPIPGGWEIQTEGKGSTFRIANTKTGKQYPVIEKRLYAVLTQMAFEVRNAYHEATGGEQDAN